ncbi:hypothetical protein GCM10027286_23850 [Virgibacillus ainsalahensis]
MCPLLLLGPKNICVFLFVLNEEGEDLIRVDIAYALICKGNEVLVVNNQGGT